MTMVHIHPMRLLVIFLIALLVTGCGMPAKEAPDQVSADPEQLAREYLHARNFSAAAQEYLRLASENTGRAVYYKLKAGGSYIQAGEITLAEQLLAGIAPEKLSPSEQVERNILFAQIANTKNDSTTALAWLDIELPADLPALLLVSYHKSRAIAYTQGSRFIEGLQERETLASLLESADAIQENNKAIWDLLAHFTEAELELQRAASTGDLEGWLELALLSRTMLYRGQELEKALQAWQERHPEHPAIDQILPGIIAMAEEVNIQPRIIALLLPFSEQYRQISHAIREGFLGAWYEALPDKPHIRIYDTSAQDIRDVYQTAVYEGADFIVGPLEKATVAALIQNGTLPVRTLVLNQTEPRGEEPAEKTNVPAIPSVFQFGLLPEEEARLVAERAWFDGHGHALIITPDTAWGERIYNAFNTQFIQLGGRIIEHAKVPVNTENYSLPVKQILNIDSSDQRAKDLTTLLRRKIYSEPRRRHDADFIFMAAEPLMARQLIPQLQFYRADDIPTYSISSVYSGIFSPQADSDINNVIFADMPWIVDPGHEYSPLQQTLNRNWKQNDSSYRRLYAFGIDAYRIIPHLGRLFLQNERFEGETGTLTITRDGRIHRKLVWTKFINGTPRLLDAGHIN
jgi:uncharacterized protein